MLKNFPFSGRQLVLSLLLLSGAASAWAQPGPTPNQNSNPNSNQSPGAPTIIRYASTAPGVSYDHITALNYSTPAAMIPYAGDLLQFGLLWLPVNERRPPAQIVFIHGGCWLNASDVRQAYAISTALAQAGFAVWTLEYRRVGDSDGGWPWTFEDIKSGIAHVHPVQDFVDIPVIVMGHSAGGHLALLAGAADPSLKGVIGLAAVTDIIEYAQGDNSCQRATTAFMGGSYDNRSADYHAANPAEKPPHPNTVLLHGRNDTVVPAEQASLPGVRTVMLDDAGHFDWVHPGTPAFQTVLETLREMLQP